MQALFYTGDLQIELREIPRPEPAAGEALVEIHSCGICGSDMHAYHGKDERRVPPLILGHEVVGTVRSGPMTGQRVAVNPLISCGVCPFCRNGRPHLCAERQIISMRRPGGFAEWIAMPEGNLWPLADDLSFDQAVLMEPLAVAVHTVELGRRVCTRPLNEGRAVILGGGAIGLLCALVLSAQGVRDLWVAEMNDGRRALIERTVDARCYDPRHETPEAQSVDLLIDAVGSGGTRQASVGLVRSGGWIVHVGLENQEPGLDTRALTLREIGLIGSYCYSDADIRAALAYLERGLCAHAPWLERRALADGSASFHDIHTGKAPPKIVLHM